VQTLALRLERQCATAVRIASFLAEHPKVAHVGYAGLPSHPDHARAEGLFGERGFGAMLSFSLADGYEAASRASEALRVARERPESGLGQALADGREIAGPLVTELAHDGDDAASEVIELIGTRLGIAVASYVNIFNPEVVVIGGGVPTTAKLTKTDSDDFDNWSKERGKTLARANQRLNARALSGFLSSSAWGWPGARFGRWGLWTWSPFSSCYTFLPFNYGWGSPYGGFYGMFAGFGGFYPDGSCCRTHVYNQPVIVSNPSYTPGTGGSGTTGSTGSSGSGGSGGLDQHALYFSQADPN